MQCGTITGIVIASAINIGTSRVVWGWRISLGLAAVPGSILLLGTQFEIEFDSESQFDLNLNWRTYLYVLSWSTPAVCLMVVLVCVLVIMRCVR